MKQSEAKFKSIFSHFFHFFHFFSLFFAFFAYFLLFSLFFALNFSLRFDLVIFASKRNKAKRNSSLFFRFFAFFHFFRFFCFYSLNFRFASIFHLILAYFTFVFASDFWCFASKWILWNQAFFASKQNKIFAWISNFASEVKVRAHPSYKFWWISASNCHRM